MLIELLNSNMRQPRPNRGLRRISTAALCSLILLVYPSLAALARQNSKIGPLEHDRAVAMMEMLHDALKKNYYDPTFHGVDMEARYKVYLEKVKTAPTLATALRAIAAYLVALDDSHTIFLPPDYSFHFDYGYRMQMIGDRSFITDVRPNSDAAAKLHPGDQVLTLDGYGLKRKDMWQLEYYLNALAPKSATKFELLDPAGSRRTEEITTAHSAAVGIHHLSPYDRLDLYEKWRHQMRDRYVEFDDVLMWKMRGFIHTDVDIDHMIAIARKHKALILDLRGNGGGSVDTLRYLIASVMDHEVHIGTSITRKGKHPLDSNKPPKDNFTGKIIVLVDSRSASASEIFARVIQLEHRGTVMGDVSSGSVMEAQIFPMQYGTDLIIYFGAEITGADLQMTDGNSLERMGVTPDVLILPTPQDLAEKRDPVLSRAAEMVGVKLDPAAAGKIFPYEWPPAPQ